MAPTTPLFRAGKVFKDSRTNTAPAAVRSRAGGNDSGVGESGDRTRSWNSSERQLAVWHERHELERPGEFPREIAVSAANATLGVIRMVESDQVIAPHKNKYGEDYKPPRPPGSIYKKPGGG
jgi:hypothetical protein